MQFSKRVISRGAIWAAAGCGPLRAAPRHVWQPNWKGRGVCQDNCTPRQVALYAMLLSGYIACLLRLTSLSVWVCVCVGVHVCAFVLRACVRVYVCVCMCVCVHVCAYKTYANRRRGYSAKVIDLQVHSIWQTSWCLNLSEISTFNSTRRISESI